MAAAQGDGGSVGITHVVTARRLSCGRDGKYRILLDAVYWRLESFFELVAANAQHIKAVPSRKTDIQDANWIADLLQHGLLTASLFRARNTRSARFNAAAGQFGSRASTSRQSRA